MATTLDPPAHDRAASCRRAHRATGWLPSRRGLFFLLDHMREILGDAWRRDVARPALKAKPLQRAAKSIGELAISIEIDLDTLCGLALHLLAGNCDRCAAAGKLLLAFAQEI